MSYECLRYTNLTNKTTCYDILVKCIDDLDNKNKVISELEYYRSTYAIVKRLQVCANTIYEFMKLYNVSSSDFNPYLLILKEWSVDAKDSDLIYKTLSKTAQTKMKNKYNSILGRNQTMINSWLFGSKSFVHQKSVRFFLPVFSELKDDSSLKPCKGTKQNQLTEN